MVLQIDDFKEQKVSLDDFEKPEAVGVPVSDKNASMVAAVDSAITGPTVEQYRQTKEDLLNPENREKFLLRQVMIREALTNDSFEAASGVVADEALSDTVRQHALLGRGASPVPIETTELDILAEEAAVADSDVNETDKTAAARYSTIGMISQVNKQKIEAQKAINGVRQSMSTSLGATVVDIAELMVPFAEWIHVDAMLRETTDEFQWGLLGTQKQKLYDQIKSMPVEKRAEFTQTLIDLVQEHENVVLWDGNTIATIDTLNNALLNDDYSNFERWFDNATSVLDVLGIGASVRALGKSGKTIRAAKDAREAGLTGEIVEGGDVVKARPFTEEEAIIIEGEYEDVTDRMANARIEATHTEVAKTSPSQVVKDVNPEEARNIHKAAMDDETGEMAEALYGTSREEAAAKDLLPEPEVKKGEMPNKVVMDGPITEEPEAFYKGRNRDGNTYLSETELNRVRENLIDGLENIEGMRAHKESMVVETNKDSTFSISVRYSPRDSGFTSPSEALDNAMYAFRNYRFQEEDFIIQARMGDKWVDMTSDDVTAFQKLKETAEARGIEIPQITDYSVKLRADYRFRPEDLDDWELLTTKRNWLDTIPAHQMSLSRMGQGSLTQNLFDASSVLHPQIVNPTAVAADREFYLKKLYVDSFADFSRGYAKLPKARRAMMTDYINEANFKGLPLDHVDLAARGFNSKERKLLDQWRKSNDAMWYAANEDMAQTLRSNGYKVFVHGDSQTKVVGRPISKSQIGSGEVAYDPVTGTVRELDDLDQIYETGGEVFKLSDPVKVGDTWVDQVISRNTPANGYVKEIGEGERVLAYRDGYYPVMYDAKWFITMKVKGRNGRTMTKVVASAKNTKDRNRALDQLRRDHPDAEFDARPDKRRADQVAMTFDDGAWQLATSSGYSAQKFRGERLKDAGVDLHKAGYSNLEDPLVAVSNQINQMSQKVAMRPVIDSMKKRWMSNYGKYLDLPINEATGEYKFPASITEIKGLANTPAKMVADARSLFNYVYAMENGYINGIDMGYRAVLHTASDWLGEKGLIKGEEWSNELAKYSPASAAKAAAFKLFLAGNPARQAIIQRAQIVTLAPINPKYVSGQLQRDWFQVNRARFGMTKDERALRLWKEVEEAGVIEAVNAHTFIRQDLLHLADLTAAQKVGTVANAPLKASQAIGFDAAEQDLLISAWLTFRDKAQKAGKDITTQRVKDEILGEARTFTYNMNRSGEMPYNKNTLSLAAQFFSVQHKSLLQGVTNRNLSRADRAKLVAYTATLFGADATIVTALVNAALGDDESSEVKDAIKNGLIDYSFNAALTAATGEDQQIDWGDIAPSEAYGVGNSLIAMLRTDVAEMVAESPSGSLLFGGNPRVAQAYKTALHYFVPYTDYKDPELQTKFTDVVSASANLFSGYSNAFKSNYAFNTGKKLSSVGNVTDEDITKVESVMAFFGFQTKTETGYRKLSEIQYGDSSFRDDDVRKFYTDLKRHLVRRGDTVREGEIARRVLSEAWEVFGQDRPRAIEIIIDQIEKDAQNKDYTVLKGITNKMGMNSSEDVWKMINALPPGKGRDRLSENMKTLEEHLNER